MLSESSDYYEQAKSIILHDKRVSISYLQRKLKVGYNQKSVYTLFDRLDYWNVEKN